MNQNPPLPSRTRFHASALRGTPTDAESALWFHLRAGRLDGLKFRRQHPLPPYVVDFYCHEAKLVVELDGSQHSDSADSTRTAALNRQGLCVMRFWDNDVLQRTESVLVAILNAARSPTLTPTPLPEGEGLKRTDP
ncbi:MAG TPA: endonuclease domain-containing protein [Rhodanobacteraceae bacterium]|nr:endonuclease domain-containing protein [Rhodanobacteraceae bacterium]